MGRMVQENVRPTSRTSEPKSYCEINSAKQHHHTHPEFEENKLANTVARQLIATILQQQFNSQCNGFNVQRLIQAVLNLSFHKHASMTT